MFEVKDEAERKDAAVLVSMPRELRRRIEQAARKENTSLSEVGRRALETFFEQREERVDAETEASV